MNLFKSELRSLIKSFIMSVRDVERTDQIFKVISNPLITNAQSYEMVHKKLSESPACMEMINSRFAGTWSLDELMKLPQDSFGYIYAKHMKDNGLEINFYPTVPGDTDHVYIQMRSRQTHDIWHVLSGFDTSSVGEVGLQAFSLPQYNSRLSIMIIVIFLLHSCFSQPANINKLFYAIVKGWQSGHDAKPLFAEKFEECWAKNLDEYRKELNIIPFAADTKMI